MNATILNGTVMFRVAVLMLGILVAQPDESWAGGVARGNQQGAGLVSQAAKLTKIDRARIEAEIYALSAFSVRMEQRDEEIRAVQIFIRLGLVLGGAYAALPVLGATGATAAQLTAAQIALALKDIREAMEIAFPIAEMGVELWDN